MTATIPHTEEARAPIRPAEPEHEGNVAAGIGLALVLSAGLWFGLWKLGSAIVGIVS